MTENPAVAQAAHPKKVVVVTALGVTQILAWGSTFYLLGVLGPFIARDTGWSYDFVFGGVSLGLLVAGLVSPRVGHFIRHRGGRTVLAAGAVLLASGLFGLGVTPNSLGTSRRGRLSAWGWEPAYTTPRSRHSAPSTAHSGGRHTSLTLFGGFASTVCWPLSAFFVEHLGWRGACLC